MEPTKADLSGVEFEDLEKEIVKRKQDKINAVKAEIADLLKQVDAKRQYLISLGGVAPITDTRVSAPAGGRKLLPEIARKEIVTFISSKPVSIALRAHEIGSAVGLSGSVLNDRLSELVKEGTLTRTGQRRGTSYTLATAPVAAPVQEPAVLVAADDDRSALVES